MAGEYRQLLSRQLSEAAFEPQSSPRMSESVHHRLTIPIEHAGQRLDQVLAELLEGYSRTRIKEWIDAGEVLVNGARLRPKDKVVGGENVEISATLPDVVEVAPEQIGLNIVHQDKHVLVINKPAGLVVHPGAGNAAGTLQNALLHFDPKLSQVPRAGIVHRLDKDTSGLMVVARTVEAHTALVSAIEAREVEREYEAVCVGVMTGGGVVDAPIDRHPVDRLKMAVRENGREAVTHYRVLHRFRGHTHVRLKLESGRTHQIRVHMMHIHYPLVGDRVYGGRMLLPKGAAPELVEALRGFRRQALHAARLSFEHPVTGKPVTNDAPLPEDMQALLAVLARDAASVKKA
jgi:23S rRNA pseudouridine1911/1915/1917 synthase